MKEKDKFLLGFTSIVLFFVLLLFENIFYITLNINLNSLDNNIRLITNITYVTTSLIISILFYLKNKTAKNMKNRLITFAKGLGALLCYLTLSQLQLIPSLLIGVDYETMPMIGKIIYSISYELLILAIICLILNKEIKKAYIDIKKNHKIYFSKYLKYWFLALIIMVFSNLFISILNNGSIAGNEQTIRNLFNISPIYIFISAVLLAPLLEELVFRQSLRNMFTNDTIFIIISGLIFGGLHVAGNVNSAYDLLYLIPYCTPGFIFAYVLTKTNNIFASTGLHLLHNGVMVSLQFLLLLLGQI